MTVIESLLGIKKKIWNTYNCQRNYYNHFYRTLIIGERIRNLFSSSMCMTCYQSLHNMHEEPSFYITSTPNPLTYTLVNSSEGSGIGHS